MSNIQSLPGIKSYSGEPNAALVAVLRDLLAQAAFADQQGGGQQQGNQGEEE